ncbi:MAG: helix-turn-helix domain-containing protein [Clostridia bacterium]|nr:helix-turn-helix domain-containing protein [Clostridia bacterium]
MNPIAKEIASYLGSAEMTDEEFLEHYGMPRRSGRYPWGSGKDNYQHSNDFLARVEKLKKEGWKETPENIKKEFGLSVKQYRMEKSICNDTRRSYQVATAKSLKEDGLSNSEIGRRMGVNESTVRGWFDKESESRMMKCKETADFLKQQVDKKRMIDVGSEVERELNISREKLDTALYMLEREGYHIHGGRVPQPTNKNQMTTLKVLAAPDVPHKDIFQYENIKTINDYISRDGGDTYEKKFTYPSSMDSKRLKIRYKEDGGEDKDGIVELRRGVPDLDLKGSRYSQVRILVDGTHYIKGMAVYSDDMPDGVDVVFNTNKGKKTPKMEVLKEIKKDPDNPFGSAIKDADQGGQYWYTDKNGKKKLGLINKRADEGDWSDWADTLPSQFLSKQSKHMAKKQLDLAKADKAAEFDEIMSLTNPTVKKHFLEKFASSCDKAAVDLKAAALPGQKYHVIIPINSMGDDKIYAPNYKDGTKLALVRYPHGGTFEIPILTVDNKNATARRILGTDVKDAVGITKKVADRLSGADFDGDTVMCIPTHDRKGKVKIASRPELEGLKGFDPKLKYGADPDGVKTDANGNKRYYREGREYKPMKEGSKNTQMGIISNLITDMTLFGANESELAAAVRHSMVVIDAPKHKLDYKQSYIDNNIAALQKKYQAKVDKNGNIIGAGGASTIVSKSKGEQRVDKRRGEAKINQKGKSWYDPKKPEGSLIYTRADDKDLYYVDSTYNKKTGVKTVKTANGKTITYKMNDKADREKYEPVMKKDPKTGAITYTNKDGSISYRVKKRTINSTRMAETDDAYTLVSNNGRGHPMEILYADYANHMKAMANKARIEMIRTGNLESNPQAKKIYQKEVSSLEAKLNDALKNTVRERAATRLASAEIKAKKSDNPDLKGEDLRKVSQRSLTKYRSEVGSISRRDRAINITDKEWEAIQAGAISENKLKKILNNSDVDSLRERAMPKATKSLSAAQINRIKRLSDSNFTLNQIAEKMGVSSATISKYLKGEN